MDLEQHSVPWLEESCFSGAQTEYLTLPEHSRGVSYINPHSWLKTVLGVGLLLTLVRLVHEYVSSCPLNLAVASPIRFIFCHQVILRAIDQWYVNIVLVI